MKSDILSIFFMSTCFLEVSSDMVTFSTPGDWKSVYTTTKGIDISGTLWQYFWVKGCNDMFVHLLPESGTDGSFVGLGVISNAKANMKLCGGCSEYFSAQFQYVSCSESRPFWVSWIGGIQEVGQGHIVGENVMITSGHNTLGFAPGRMGFSSGWSAVGEWTIEDNPPATGRLCFYRHVNPFNSRTSRPSFKTINPRSRQSCAAECRNVRGCKSFTYLSSDSTCSLQTDKPRPEDVFSESVWELWVLQ